MKRQYIEINGQYYPVLIEEIGQDIKPRKAKSKKAKSKSTRLVYWIFVFFLSFFALLIIKNWYIEATTTPERVERKK